MRRHRPGSQDLKQRARDFLSLANKFGGHEKSECYFSAEYAIACSDKVPDLIADLLAENEQLRGVIHRAESVDVSSYTEGFDAAAAILAILEEADH